MKDRDKAPDPASYLTAEATHAWDIRVFRLNIVTGERPLWGDRYLVFAPDMKAAEAIAEHLLGEHSEYRILHTEEKPMASTVTMIPLGHCMREHDPKNPEKWESAKGGQYSVAVQPDIAPAPKNPKHPDRKK